MAKRRARSGQGKAKSERKSPSARSPIRKRTRSAAKKAATRKATVSRKKASRKTASAAARKSGAAAKKTKRRAESSKRGARQPSKAPRLNRPRRTLDETVPTPPSSLDMKRGGSAVRTGRAEIAESVANHASMSPEITGGDVDTDVENAYFSGDETPGGDNPTPDQNVVDDIGKALGVEYQDNEELRGSDKVAARDKRRWELDPAPADYRDRKK